MLTYKTPGVYIEEIPTNGPIEGVGTSTVAFIGPALQGPINKPVKITNWTQFTQGFGNYISSPRRFLAFGVRGFYQNGGTVAYVVRVGTAQRAHLDLDDRAVAALPTIVVTAKSEGPAGNSITAAVQDAQIVAAAQNARVRKAQAAISSAANNVVNLTNPADALLFKPGDWVTVISGTDRAQIDRIRGGQIFLTSNLVATYAAGTVRIADLAIGQKTFRVNSGMGLEPGSVIHLAQGATTEDRIIDGVVGEFVTLAVGVTNSYSLLAAGTDVAITSYEFRLIFVQGAVTETFDKLSMDSRHSRYFMRVVDSTLVEVSLADPPTTTAAPRNRPAVLVATNLAGGLADNLAAIGLTHYQAALDALVKLEDVNVICAPDADQNVQAAMVAHCESTANRFAVLDALTANLAPFGAGSVETQRAAVESGRGYAALYYPWIQINDPLSLTGEDTIFVPPSGHVAGIYARSDTQRGVHKAPANEFITGAVGLSRILDGTEQGELNIEGINVLRIFPGKARPMVWGARSTSPKDDTTWRYVNVRRLFLFLEQSIQKGIAWSVFEPNDLGLWKKLERTLDEFLTRVWRSGALFGATADEAFYVKIDEELNPPSVRALGQVIIEIGVAPVRPAEFVVVRIGMWDGGTTTAEG